MAPTPFPTASTPMPNAFIDEVMPTLKDTEWRVLCVVVRQTLGWRVPAGKARRSHDWLTHSQLRVRTGRSSEAVCQAVDALVQRGLLEVRSEAGNLLTSPLARRRATGRLYYGLPAQLTKEASREPSDDAAGVERDALPISENRVSISKSEKRKAKTTKETGYKIDTDSESIGSSAPAPSAAGPLQQHEREHLTPEVEQLLAAYQHLSERHGIGPLPLQAADGTLAEHLLAEHPYEDLVRLLQTFFVSEHSWVRHCGYTFSAFVRFIPYLLLAERLRSRGPLHGAAACRL